MCAAYAKVDSLKLRFLKSPKGQKQIRADSYRAVQEAVAATPVGDVACGKPVILPASYVGSQRYMSKKYKEAMAIVRAYGKPSFFVTITCNPKWPAITAALEATGGSAQDRIDVVNRVFKQHLDQLRNDLITKKALGTPVAYLDVIEFQKRGLPHAHILVILERVDRLVTEDDIDAVVTAELPVKPKRGDYPDTNDGLNRYNEAMERFERLR